MSGLLALLFLAALQAGEFEIRGNRELSSRALRQAAVDELADLERGGYRRTGADDAAYVMETYCKSQGYPDATVGYRVEERDAVRRVTFEVQEGPRCILAALSISGQEFFTAEALGVLYDAPATGLFGMGATVYVATAVEALRSAIALRYLEQGFLDVVVAPAEVTRSAAGTEASVHLAITEGVRYRIVAFEFAGNQHQTSADLDLLLSPLLATPFVPQKLYEARAALEESYGDLGYATAEASVEAHFVEPAGDVVLRCLVEEGLPVRIRNIVVSGNTNTRDSFIHSRLELEPGAMFRRADERESFRNLFATGLFEKVDLTLRGDAIWRDLLVDVRELPSQEVYFSPGFGSYEGLRGKAGIEERNLLGTGRQGRASVSASQKGEGATLGYTDPWFAGSDFNLDVSLNARRREEPAFTVREYGLSVLQRRSWTPLFSTLHGYQVRRSSTTDEEVVSEFLDSLRIANLRFEVNYDSRDDLFNPSDGYRSSLLVEFGDEWLASELSFVRVTLSHTHAFPLHERLVLALQARTGLVRPFGDSDVIPLQERFFNGGERTVRSYQESELGPRDASNDPLGGEVVNVFNAELRFQVNRPFQVAAFYDAGNVGLTVDDYFENFGTAIGGGLRYLLPIGAVRLDLAANPNRRSGEDAFVAHLSVGMAF